MRRLRLALVLTAVLAPALAHGAGDWPELPEGEAFWNEGDATDCAFEQADLAAQLQAENAWLRQQLHRLSPKAADPDRNPWRDPAAVHGRTLFVTMCAGDEYFRVYCSPFLSSFERAYGAEALRHSVTVFVQDVSAERLKRAARRFAPWVRLVALTETALFGAEGELFIHADLLQHWDTLRNCPSGSKGYCTSTEQDLRRQRKVDLENANFPLHLFEFLTKTNEEFDYLVNIDSDTLFVRPLAPFLSPEWHVALTAYDEGFAVPWTEDSREVGATASGFARVNAGVVMVNLQDKARALRFLIEWGHSTRLLLKPEAAEAMDSPWAAAQWERWALELLDEFRGANQASLALLLSSYDTQRLGSLLGFGPACKACREAVEARMAPVGLAHGKERPTMRFRALPAHILNHPESMVDGKFPPDLRVVHLKGQWWRQMLEQQRSFVTPTRTPVWNKAAIFHYLQMQIAAGDVGHVDLPSGRPAEA